MQWTKLLICLIWLLPIHFAVAEEERVQVGDLIQVNLPGESTLNKGFQVDKRGRIALPEVGTLYVAGYTEEQLERAVTEALEKDPAMARAWVSLAKCHWRETIMG